MVARGWGLSPTDFWDMTLPEFFAEYDTREYYKPNDKFAGKMSQAQVDELTEWAESDGA